MIELKKKVLQIIDNINDDWTNTIKNAEETGEGIDLNSMFKKFSTNVKDLDEAFNEASIRVHGKKKGIWE